MSYVTTTDVIGDDDAGPWWSAHTKCPVCGHEDVSVFPDQAQKLECGGCGHMMERPEDTQPWSGK